MENGKSNNSYDFVLNKDTQHENRGLTGDLYLQERINRIIKNYQSVSFLKDGLFIRAHWLDCLFGEIVGFMDDNNAKHYRERIDFILVGSLSNNDPRFIDITTRQKIAPLISNIMRDMQIFLIKNNIIQRPGAA